MLRYLLFLCFWFFLGWWEEDVLQVILKYLVIGNTEVRLDLIKTMVDGKNVQYVNKVKIG
jgi:septum formation topological specificity factor MinE